MRYLHRRGWRAVAAALALAAIAAWVLSPLGASTALAAQQVVEDIRVVNDLDDLSGGPTEVAELGDELRFLIGVANESPYWLRDIRIRAPLVGLDWEVGSDLAPRTTAGALSALIARSYTVTEADLPGPVVNTVTVTAVLDRGEFGGDLPLEIVVTESIPIAALSLTKSAEPSEVELGEEVTYTFTVTNTGSVPLQTVTILDPALDHFGVNFGTIHPGDSRSEDWAYAPQADDFVGGALEAL